MPILLAASNVPCGTTGVTCTKSVEIKIYNQTLHLVRGQDIEIGSNSITTNQYYTRGLVVENIGGMFITVVAPELGIVIKYDEGMVTRSL